MKFFAFLIFAIIISFVQSQNRILNPTGADSGNCIANPCVTVQYAYTQITTVGEEIHLQPSSEVYPSGSTSTLVNNFPLILRGLGGSKNDTVIRLSGNQPFIQAIGNTQDMLNEISNLVLDGSPDNTIGLFDGDQSDWRFSSLTIQNAASPVTAILLRLESNGQYDFQDVEFLNNRIVGTTQSVSAIIEIEDTASSGSFNNCRWSGNRAGTSPVHVRVNQASNVTNPGSTFSFTNCSMTRNIGDSDGGFMFIQDSLSSSDGNPVITFTNITADSNSGTEAGFLYATQGTITISDSTITNHVSFSAGGAIDLDNAIISFVVQNCNFGNNDIIGLESGGAIIFDSSTATYLVNSSTFLAHFLEPISAGGGIFSANGGVIAHRQGTLTIQDSNFNINSVGPAGNGGALEIRSACTVADSTFTNTNGLGGFIVSSGMTTLERVSISSYPIDLVFNGGSTIIDDSTSTTNFDKNSVFLQGGTLTINNNILPSTWREFDMSGGTLTIDNELIISETFTWSGGTITGSGNLTFATGAIVNLIPGATSRTLSITTVNNALMQITDQSGNCLDIRNNFTNFGTLITSQCTISVRDTTFTNIGRLSSRGTFWQNSAGSTSFMTFSSSGTTSVQVFNEEGGVNGLTFMSSSGAFTVTLAGAFAVERLFPFGPTQGQNFPSAINSSFSLNGVFNNPGFPIAGTLASNVNNFDLSIGVVSFALGDDEVRTKEDTPVSFNPFENDISSGGILVFNNQINGLDNDATLITGPTLFTFTPPPDESGIFSFDYAVQDGSGTSDTARVIVTVLPVNDGPQVNDIENVVVNRRQSSFSFPVRDVDNDDSELQFFLLSLPASGGTITVAGQPITTTPVMIPRTVDFTVFDGNDDSVTYLVSDGQIVTNSATLSINFDNSTDNTAVIIGAVLGSVIGCCCLVVIALSISLAVWKAKKPPKDALVNLLLQPDLAVARALQGTIELEKEKQLALYYTEFFSYHKSTHELVSYYIAEEISKVEKQDLLFRENNFSSKLLKTYADVLGRQFLRKALSDIIDDILDEDDIFEVNSKTEKDPKKLKNNQKKIKKWCNEILEGIFNNKDHLPIECKQICSELYKQSNEKWENSGMKAVGAFLFLRWISPAIISPQGWGISSSSPSKGNMRNLLLIVKVLQSLATGTEFGSKEEYMSFMNDWLTEKKNDYEAFIAFAKDDTEGESSPDISKSVYKSSLNEIHKLIFDQLAPMTEKLEKEEEKDTSERLEKIMILLGPPDDSDVNEELQILAESQERSPTLSQGLKSSNVSSPSIDPSGSQAEEEEE